MLLYLSSRKIENLCSEFNINRSFFNTIIPNSINTKWGFKLGIADGSIESQHIIQNTNHLFQVLKKLKDKNVLMELISGTTYIKPFNYYICDGKLSYDGHIDGYISSLFSNEILEMYRDDSFFADDKLKFKVKISHDKYQFVNILCTADSIQVFGSKDLSVYYSDLFKNGERIYFSHSGDPGILHRELPVKLIFWCLKADEILKQIDGSPLMISC